MVAIIHVHFAQYHCRGKSRSGTISETIKAAKDIAESGNKEIVLTGVNIGDFGKGNDESFIDLIKELDCLNEINRIRISSIEPNLSLIHI